MTEPTRRDRSRVPAFRPLGAGERVGAYVLTGRRIGQGSFGEVFEASGQSAEVGLRVAIKVQETLGDPTARERALREARALARIQHRHVVRIFDAGELEDGRHYLAMELLGGETLREVLAREGRMAPDRALALLASLAGALDAVHARGLVHRDLKPSNVFLCRDDDGEVYPKLIDFGIAKDAETPAGGDLTRSGAFMGTPVYMSPEQAAMRRVDARSDIYSLGLLAYELLAGAPPFQGEPIDVAHQHLHAAVPPITTARPELPATVDEAFAKLLAKAPDDRPASAGEAVQRLARALAGEGARPSPPRAASRRRRWTAAGVIAAVAIAGALAASRRALEGNPHEESHTSIDAGADAARPPAVPDAAGAAPAIEPAAPAPEPETPRGRRRGKPGINDLERLRPR